MRAFLVPVATQTSVRRDFERRCHPVLLVSVAMAAHDRRNDTLLAVCEDEIVSPEPDRSAIVVR
jgi:hypothetical protein